MYPPESIGEEIHDPELAVLLGGDPTEPFVIEGPNSVSQDGYVWEWPSKNPTGRHASGLYREGKS